MSTTKRKTQAPVAVPTAASQPDLVLNWEEVAAAIFQARGINSGWHRLGIRLHFAAMTMGISENGGPPQEVPAGMVATDAVALFKTTTAGPMTFDAGNGGARVPPGAVWQVPTKSAPASPKTVRKKRSFVVRKEPS